jgi:hypothetical protein
MKRLAITGVCAIALLSGCGGPQPRVAGETNIALPCKGKDVNTGEWELTKNKQTVVFHTDGRCNFTKPTDFSFVGDDGKDPPPGFKRLPVTYPSATISYDYDGRPIAPKPPAVGYTFTYENDYTKDGNGSGVIKSYRGS